MGFCGSMVGSQTAGAYPYIASYNGSWAAIVSATAAVVNTWYHLAASFNGTTTITFTSAPATGTNNIQILHNFAGTAAA